MPDVGGIVPLPRSLLEPAIPLGDPFAMPHANPYSHSNPFDLLTATVPAHNLGHPLLGTHFTPSASPVRQLGQVQSPKAPRPQGGEGTRGGSANGRVQGNGDGGANGSPVPRTTVSADGPRVAGDNAAGGSRPGSGAPVLLPALSKQRAPPTSRKTGAGAAWPGISAKPAVPPAAAGAGSGGNADKDAAGAGTAPLLAARRPPPVQPPGSAMTKAESEWCLSGSGSHCLQ